MINKIDYANVIGAEGYYKHDYNKGVYLKSGNKIEPVNGVYSLHLRKGTVKKTWPEIFPYVMPEVKKKKKKNGR